MLTNSKIIAAIEDTIERINELYYENNIVTNGCEKLAENLIALGVPLDVRKSVLNAYRNRLHVGSSFYRPSHKSLYEQVAESLGDCQEAKDITHRHQVSALEILKMNIAPSMLGKIFYFFIFWGLIYLIGYAAISLFS